VIAKLLLALMSLLILLGSIYFAIHQRNHGVLDSVKLRQVPAMRSAKTIRDYRQ
jgi:hypothetical protein